jgi:hypothetical protein
LGTAYLCVGDLEAYDNRCAACKHLLAAYWAITAGTAAVLGRRRRLVACVTNMCLCVACVVDSSGIRTKRIHGRKNDVPASCAALTRIGAAAELGFGSAATTTGIYVGAVSNGG